MRTKLKNITFRHLALVMIFGLFSLAAMGQVSRELNGTWVIDIKQTEEFVKRVDPPPHNAEWLPAILLRQCITTMTFEGDTMTMDPISPSPMVQSFRLEPQKDRKLTYLIQTDDGGKDTLTISFLNEENITVKSAKVELNEYGVWKRGKRPNRQTTQQDFMQALDTCASVLKNVSFIKATTR